MNIRRSILWLCATIAVLIALLVWFAKKPVETLLPTPVETIAEPSTTEQATTKPSQREASPPRHTNAPTVQAAPGGNVPAPPTQTKAEQMKEGLATLNNEDVALYGKVIDQFNSPVANAIVAGSIQVNNGIRVGTDHMSTVTDSNGLFKISGYKGKNIGINVSKAGYVLATAKTSFVYSLLWSEAERYNPDPNNPAVIKMWKLQGAEALIGINQRFKFHYTDAPVNFDLLTGEIVPNGGDIKINMSRSPGIVSERTLQDWSVQVEAVEGGLIKTSMAEARVTYQAPENGYQSSDTFIMSTNASHKWFGGIDQMYFVQSRGGRVYSKINFGIGINQQPGDNVEVEFHGTANANNSRNWEGDLENTHLK